MTNPKTIELKSYPPSFIDRFMNAVQRLPVPYWLTYLALFMLESATLHVLSWIEGWLPAYTISPILFLFPLWLWGPLAFITYLNSISLKALDGFAPLLDIQAEALQHLKNEFTTMPARSVMISGVFWASVYLIFAVVVSPAIFAAFSVGPILTAINTLAGLISYFLGSIIYYHSIRQLRLINRTVNLVNQFNLFQLEPVYEFSLVTSRTGIAWVMLLSSTLLTLPIQFATIPVLVLLIVQVTLAIAAFVLPLQIVHQRLVAQKQKLLAEHQQRTESTLAKLHRYLDNNELGDMVQLDHAVIALNYEREILSKIPTWPWRAGMLTGFLSIAVLPIILFLVQLVIGRLLGG